MKPPGEQIEVLPEMVDALVGGATIAALQAKIRIDESPAIAHDDKSQW